MEEIIARGDESRRKERLQREQRSPSRDPAPVGAKPAERDPDHRVLTKALAQAINEVNRLVARGFYCSIEGRPHPYGQQPIRNTVASLTAVCAQISTWGGTGRKFPMSGIAAHWLQMHQSEECAQRSLWGDMALLHDSTAARVGALFQLLVQDTTAQDFGLPSSAIRLRM